MSGNLLSLNQTSEGGFKVTLPLNNTTLNGFKLTVLLDLVLVINASSVNGRVYKSPTFT